MRSLDLPDFPWDRIEPIKQRAARHEDGLIDLSVGSPVDETPAVIREALREATDAHAYPATAGSEELRQAIIDWFARRRGVTGLEHRNVLPTIGSKEFIATAPLMLGARPGDAVVVPVTAYPTYEIGARLAGAETVRSDDPAEWPANTRVVWVNSPGNPDGRVLGIGQLRAAVLRARELGAVIISDECYAELNWQGADAADRPASDGDGDGDSAPTPSILDPRVLGGSRLDTLAVYSLSKQSNLAGYRAGLVAGCGRRIAQLLEARKHAGLMPPAPVQHAMAVALGDDAHVAKQRERYRARRELLKPALEAAGFRIDHSAAGLYLWATEGRPAIETLDRLAGIGILAAPGTFYGDPESQHVRFALTASDDRMALAAERLARFPSGEAIRSSAAAI
ncbi:succinyldiaminopimelate transaminase [Ruicaihuangia caeni]|uniref:Aminotransferase n=1 Tax=Ruicaihuangia caeni TaxID=3042517 RepID=A0AAW6TCB5_9MICO|nr:succinyldiaminopimelate transaminase [Klugiella sp. YN-L-19]MDI2099655.1 succinyldiaminopimelate transaminase [Klugiella sp. YN-L-19]